jgi:hypothetical protein
MHRMAFPFIQGFVILIDAKHILCIADAYSFSKVLRQTMGRSFTPPHSLLHSFCKSHYTLAAYKAIIILPFAWRGETPLSIDKSA